MKEAGKGGYKPSKTKAASLEEEKVQYSDGDDQNGEDDQQ